MLGPLRGRDAELASLQQHLDRLGSGVGMCWLIEGGAGLGKTRLLEEATALSRRHGYRVAHAVADPADSAVELGVLMDALFGGVRPLLDGTALNAGWLDARLSSH